MALASSDSRSADRPTTATPCPPAANRRARAARVPGPTPVTTQTLSSMSGPYRARGAYDRRLAVAHIATVLPARATGDTAETYQELRRMSGSRRVAQVVQVFSLRP